MKLVKEFSNLAEAVQWAGDLLADPESFLTDLTGDVKKVKLKGAPPATTKKEKEKEAEAPAAATENGGVSKMLVDLKEIGVQLTEMNPTRYEGVQLALAQYGVTKIKELSEEDQPKVLKMFNKMAAANKTEFADMLEYLKQ